MAVPGQKPPVGLGDFRPASVIQNWLIGKSQKIELAYEIRGDSHLRLGDHQIEKLTVLKNIFVGRMSFL